MITKNSIVAVVTTLTTALSTMVCWAEEQKQADEREAYVETRNAQSTISPGITRPVPVAIAPSSKTTPTNSGTSKPTGRPHVEVADLPRDHIRLDLLPQRPINNPLYVQPERTTPIVLSARHPNRIICEGDPLLGIHHAKDLPFDVERYKQYAMVSFLPLIDKENGDRYYANTAHDLLFICGQDAYPMVVYPENIPPQTIRLAPGVSNKVRANIEKFQAMPFAEKMRRFVEYAYNGSFPEGFDIHEEENPKPIPVAAELTVTPVRNVDVEGEGYRIRVFDVRLSQPSIEKIELSEMMFAKTEISKRIAAISTQPPMLKRGETSRLTIVERIEEAEVKP